jgi:hypothetical protein
MGGFYLAHTSSNLNGQIPAGHNLGFKDGHVEWRPFDSTIVPRTGSNTPYFWWWPTIVCQSPRHRDIVNQQHDIERFQKFCSRWKDSVTGEWREASWTAAVFCRFGNHAAR